MTNSDKTHLEQLLKNQFTELDQRFERHVKTISESFDLKIGFIADGQVILRREMHEIRDELKQDIALLDFKIETVNQHLSQKIDGVATDLKAHRADTEAHNGIYRVKER